MATTVARLQAVLSANTMDFTRDLDRAEGKMHGAGRSMASAAKLAGGAIAVGLGIGIVKSIRAASDLHEQMTKTDQIFGKNAKDVHKWAGQLAHDFGLSDRAALEYAGTYGNMLKPMGIAPKLVKTMSMRLTELGGDMASFNNADISETLLAIQSGLAGQVRPLRRFGVFLDQDRIKAEALKEGLVHASVSMADVHMKEAALVDSHKKLTEATKKYGKGSDEAQAAQAKFEYAQEQLHKVLAGTVPKLTAAQKAQASYGIIMKDTADTQGDFARTSNGAANQQRILQAELENLEAQLGQKLLPVFVVIMRFITEKFMPAMQTAVDWFNKHWPEIRQVIVQAWEQIKPSLDSFIKNAEGLVESIRKHWGTIGPIIKNVAAITQNALAIVQGEIKFFIDLLHGRWGAAWDDFKNVVSHAFDNIKRIFELWLSTVGTLAANIGKAIIHGLEAGIDAVWDGLKKKITDLFHNVIGWVKDALGIHSPSTVFHGIGQNMIQGMINGVGSMGGLLKKAVVNIAKSIPGKVLGVFHGHSPQHWDEGLDPRVVEAVMMARQYGWAGTVTSGFRTYAEQAALYQRYLHGGPLAAPPGHSSHETGSAVDVTDPAGFGRAMSFLPETLRLYNKLGARDPVHFSISGYDQGGWLPPGLSLAYNGTGRPEAVGGGNAVFNVHLAGERVVQIMWDGMRRKAKIYERNNSRPAFGGA